jgi:hypothetical protein
MMENFIIFKCDEHKYFKVFINVEVLRLRVESPLWFMVEKVQK